MKMTPVMHVVYDVHHRRHLHFTSPEGSTYLVLGLILVVLCVLKQRISFKKFMANFTHVTKSASRCFATLRQIRRSVPVAMLQTLVVALVHSRLDYGKAVLVGNPAYTIRVYATTTLVGVKCGCTAHLLPGFL